VEREVFGGGVFFSGEEGLLAMWLRLSATMLTIKVCFV
jgi:hypothetical protein